jgi:chromosome segregation ATPase
MAHQRIEIDDLNRRVESLLSEPSSTSASDSTAYTKELEQIIELLESEREDLESECTSLKDSLGAIEESMESQSAQDAKIIETLRQDLMDSEEVRIVPYTMGTFIRA